jgi:uroporphyrin-III C-methyltransferase
MKNIETTLRNVGTVSLVGAGPGDPELLTIKAVKAIAAATVLLVDDLVSPAIVALAPPGARVIHVGKRGGCKSTPQAFIEKLMVMAAREGETVVRLKGGDPFIFGRGGEEVEHLRAQGITVQVINGITAGLAGITSLGAPLTHREHAHGVLFITGHVRPGDTDTDWRAIAATARDARLTLVIYMGVRGLGAGAAGLFCAGVAGQLGLRVLVLDHSERVAEKIRISGGGRCNFTNRDVDRPRRTSTSSATTRISAARPCRATRRSRLHRAGAKNTASPSTKSTRASCSATARPKT